MQKQRSFNQKKGSGSLISLNRTQLKYIAAFAMLLDHIGMMFIPVSTPLGTLCRVIGRLTAPIMCMFLAEGFRHTKSKEKYAVRLFVFAVISQPFYAFAHGNTLMTADFNMIFTLFLSFVMLYCFEKFESDFLRILSVIVIVALSQFGDWGITAPLWVLGFYCFSNNKKKQTVFFLAVAVFWMLRATFNCIEKGYVWYGEYCQLGLFLFPFMLLSYNGEKGSSTKFSKWFFYIFYPLHLFVLKVIKEVI